MIRSMAYRRRKPDSELPANCLLAIHPRDLKVTTTASAPSLHDARPSDWLCRYLYSSNHKAIVTVYLIFTIYAGVIGVACPGASAVGIFESIPACERLLRFEPSDSMWKEKALSHRGSLLHWRARLSDLLPSRASLLPTQDMIERQQDPNQWGVTGGSLWG
jgi:hypothetical protein